MASTKDLKKRIGTVKNTQQTTRALKMVSAAKLRRAQEAIQNQRPYARAIGELIQRAASLSDGTFTSPLLGRERVSESSKPKVLLVVVTSDRGLCGGFNSNVIKGTQRWIMANGERYEQVKLAYVGRRGYDFFKSRKVIQGQYFSETGGKVTFLKARKLTDALVESYLSGEVDEVKFIFNEFKNAVTQKVVIEQFLPLSADLTGQGVPSSTPPSADAEGTSFLVKPSLNELLGSLLEKNFPIQAFRILLESQASEHGSRMSSMENATKNAGEMIQKLTLQYNKQRQAGITKELLEIISGSESQKN